MIKNLNKKYKTRYFIILHTTKIMIFGLEDEKRKEKYIGFLTQIVEQGDQRYDKWWIPSFYLHKRKSEAVYCIMSDIRILLEKEKDHSFEVA
jgi:hypothetical protein